MQEILTKIAYCVRAGETVGLDVATAESLHAVDATLWVTRKGDLGDYWLTPGMELALRPHERIWIGVDGKEGGQIELHLKRRPAAWLRLLPLGWLTRTAAPRVAHG